MLLKIAILWEKLFQRRRLKKNLNKSTAPSVYNLSLKLIFYIELTKIGNMSTIIWDEAFLDTDGVLKWCSMPKVAVPVSLAPGGVNITQTPFLLISSLSSRPEPYLKAEAIDFPSNEALCQIPDQFFEQNNC